MNNRKNVAYGLKSLGLAMSMLFTPLYLASADDASKSTSDGVVVSSATAETLRMQNDFQLTIGGTIDLQYGWVKHGEGFGNIEDLLPLPKPFPLPSKKVYDRGFVIASDINLKVSNKVNECTEYGGQVDLNTNVSPSPGGNKDVANNLMVYLQGTYGRMELGNIDTAANNLRVTPIAFAKGTGGIDGAYGDWLVYTIISTNSKAKFLSGKRDENSGVLTMRGFIVPAPYLPASSQYKKKSNKFSFYLPKLKLNRLGDVSFGFSFTPDAGVKGTSYEIGRVGHHSYRNIFSGGVQVERKLGEVGVYASLVGEVGSATDLTYSYQDFIVDTDANPSDMVVSLKRNKLRAWEAGVGLDYRGFQVAASYGDWGKSGAPNANTNSGKTNVGDHETKEYSIAQSTRNSRYITAGVAFSRGKFGASLTFMRSWRYGSPDMFMYQKATNIKSKGQVFETQPFYDPNIENKLSVISAAVQYEIRPGLTPYFEVTKCKYDIPLNDIKVNNAMVFIVGTKLRF